MATLILSAAAFTSMAFGWPLRLPGFPLASRVWQRDTFNPLHNLRIIHIRIESNLVPVALVEFGTQERFGERIELACIGLCGFIENVEADSVLSLMQSFLHIRANHQH